MFGINALTLKRENSYLAAIRQEKPERTGRGVGKCHGQRQGIAVMIPSHVVCWGLEILAFCISAAVSVLAKGSNFPPIPDSRIQVLYIQLMTPDAFLADNGKAGVGV